MNYKSLNLPGLLSNMNSTSHKLSSSTSAGPESAEQALPSYTTSGSKLSKTLKDFVESLGLWKTWSRLTIMELRSEYGRFHLGALWVPLGMAIFVFALGYVYSRLRGNAYGEFVPYLAAGMTFWTIIQSSITQSLSLFSGARAYIHNVRLPFYYYVFKALFTIFYTAFLTTPVYIASIFLFKLNPLSTLVWVLPAISIYILSAFSVLTLFGVISLRFRDVQAPLMNFMRLMFLVTPIIWMLEQKSGSKRAAFVDYNPFYHFIEIGRAPLLGQTATMTNWIVALSFTTVLFFLSVVFMTLYRRTIGYWA